MSKYELMKLEVEEFFEGFRRNHPEYSDTNLALMIIHILTALIILKK